MTWELPPSCRVCELSLTIIGTFAVLHYVDIRYFRIPMVTIIVIIHPALVQQSVSLIHSTLFDPGDTIISLAAVCFKSVIAVKARDARVMCSVSLVSFGADFGRVLVCLTLRKCYETLSIQILRHQIDEIDYSTHLFDPELLIFLLLLQPEVLDFYLFDDVAPLRRASPRAAAVSVQIREQASCSSSRIVLTKSIVSLAQRIMLLNSNSALLSGTTFCVDVQVAKVCCPTQASSRCRASRLGASSCVCIWESIICHDALFVLLGPVVRSAWRRLCSPVDAPSEVQALPLPVLCVAGQLPTSTLSRCTSHSDSTLSLLCRALDQIAPSAPARATRSASAITNRGRLQIQQWCSHHHAQPLPNLWTHVSWAGRCLCSLFERHVAIMLLQEACRTCISSATGIDQCLLSAVVPYTFQSVRHRVGKDVLRGEPGVVVSDLSWFALQPCLSHTAQVLTVEFFFRCSCQFLSVRSCVQPIDFALPHVRCHLCWCLAIDRRLVCVLSSSCTFHPSHPRRLWTCHTTTFLPCLLWPHLLEGVSRPSRHLRNLLRNRSRTHNIRRAQDTRPIHTPYRHRRLDPTAVSQRLSFAFPRRFQLHCWKLL